jgi:pimeloyl-ACP methyl ester carboxylesterase
MKSFFSCKLVLIAILFSFVLFSACKKEKDNASPVIEVTFDGITYWECVSVEVIPDTIVHYYTFSLEQNGSLLSGNVMVRDSSELINGTISGKVISDSIYIDADFASDEYDFKFRGIVDVSSGTAELSGSFQTSDASINGNDQFLLMITQVTENFAPQFLPNNPYVFRKVHSSNHPNDYPVIFIHGMTGDLTHWDEVISNLSPAFLDKHDVYVYQYNWKDSIMINGKILYDSVMAAGMTNPIIVAHSMGGLVSRAYISRGGPIYRLVALGTPHLGTDLARLTNLFIFSGFPGPRDMAPASSFIQKLTNNSNDINSRGKYVVFSGQMKGGFKIVSGRLKWVWAESYYNLTDKLGYNAFSLYGKPSNDGLVPNTSALFQGYTVLERKPVLEWVDHRNLRTPGISTEIMSYINSL